jgi:hypothetical protein
MGTVRSHRAAALGLICLLAALPGRAEVIFSAQTGSSDFGAVISALRVSQGNVTVIDTGLPTHFFLNVSSNGQLLTFSSPDPQRPHEASWDLWAHDRQAGQTRRLVDNQTQELDGGGFMFFSPLFSATSTDGQRVAYANQISSSHPSGGGSFRELRVVRATDGEPIALAEIGNGNTFDYYQSEFVGMDWLPGSQAFATPAYVLVATGDGGTAPVAGIVVFAPGQPGLYQRAGQLTTPSVTLESGTIIAETHAFPSFSPDGQQMAFFRIIFVDPLMMQPARAELAVVNLGNGSVTTLLQFNPGFYPMGVSWRGNNQLVFAIAQQSQSGGQFFSTGEPDTGQIFTVPAGGGPVNTVSGAPVGIFPNGLPLPQTIFRDSFGN